jgi:hypothetical protein
VHKIYVIAGDWQVVRNWALFRDIPMSRIVRITGQNWMMLPNESEVLLLYRYPDSNINLRLLTCRGLTLTESETDPKGDSKVPDSVAKVLEELKIMGRK